MRTAIVLVFLFLSTSLAFSARLQDPPGFPQEWEQAMEQSCTTAGGIKLSRSLYARDGREFFSTNEKNGVRFMQQMGTFDKDRIVWRAQVQKGNEVLFFDDERVAFVTASEALGMPIEEYIECYQHATVKSKPVRIRD